MRCASQATFCTLPTAPEPPSSVVCAGPTTSRTPVKPTPALEPRSLSRALGTESPRFFSDAGQNTKIRDTLNNLIVKVTRFPSAAHPRRALQNSCTCANAASSRVRSRLRIGRLGSASPSSPSLEPLSNGVRALHLRTPFAHRARSHEPSHTRFAQTRSASMCASCNACHTVRLPSTTHTPASPMHSYD